MKTALTIAGSDSSGGAGIQADIKTMTANGVFAMSAITALTAQNTTGVTGILNSTPEFLAQQLDAVFTDIYPDAVKIGMVSSQELIRVIAQKLRQYGAKHIVVDPVMVSTSGCALMSPDAQETLMTELLPLADIITPNIPDKKHVKWMTEYYYGELLKCGIRIYEYTPGFVHSKVVLEEHCAVVGTINMDYRSMFLHFECGVLLLQNSQVLALRDDVRRTLPQCREVQCADCRTGLAGTVLDSVLRLLSPLM